MGKTKEFSVDLKGRIADLFKTGMDYKITSKKLGVKVHCHQENH